MALSIAECVSPRLSRFGPLRTSLIISAVLILVACGSDDSSNKIEAANTDQTTTQAVAVVVDDGTRGAEVYQQSCASCHGTDLRGTDRGPSHLAVPYEPGHHSDDKFRSAIRNGAREHHWNFGAMPPISGLSDQDIEDVIVFVRSEQQRQGIDQS